MAIGIFLSVVGTSFFFKVLFKWYFAFVIEMEISFFLVEREVVKVFNKQGGA
jgi:hypothetical protein